jgi:imidazolonepropionase
MKCYKHLSQIVTLAGAAAKDGRRLNPEDLHIIEDAAIVFDDETIEWVGKTADLPAQYQKLPFHRLPGHVLTPELVDSHTHLVFGGDRAEEYTERLNGVPYESIAARGGGILYTVAQTRSQTEEALFNLSVDRINQISAYGVGTIEIKSGYGLSLESERMLTKLIHRLKLHFSPKVQIINTFMAAHDRPKDFIDTADYMAKVVKPLLDELGPLKIIDAVDIFHEKNYFTTEDVKALKSVASKYQVSIKLHADELNDNDGAKLAADLDALSADHLLKVSDEGIASLAASSTVATLLPGTAFFLGKPLAPARKLLNAGAKVALASDFNPGSSHVDNVLLVASISAAQLKLNQAELWAGITLNAAHALGLKSQGAIIAGLRPRFSLFRAPGLAHITYNWGKNLSVTLP